MRTKPRFKVSLGDLPMTLKNLRSQLKSVETKLTHLSRLQEELNAPVLRHSARERFDLIREYRYNLGLFHSTSVKGTLSCGYITVFCPINADADSQETLMFEKLVKEWCTSTIVKDPYKPHVRVYKFTY